MCFVQCCLAHENKEIKLQWICPINILKLNMAVPDMASHSIQINHEH